MKRILLSVKPEEVQLAVLDQELLVDFAIERNEEHDLVGRIYKGIVKNIVPGIKGMFVDIGVGKNAFLRNEDMGQTDKPITEGTSLLVQVIKDSTDTKGPCVSGKVSLSGRYAVVMSDTDYIGVSKQIRSEEKRKFLRDEGKKLCPPSMGLIIRTAAAQADPSEVKKEISRMADQWTVLCRRFRVEKGPILLYRRSDLMIRCLRDYMTADIDQLIVDDPVARERLLDAADQEQRLWKDRIIFHEKPSPMMKEYHAEEQINQLFQRDVVLPSGGSIVIDYTEALTAIDVNSGSFRGRGMPHEEMAYLINQEAVPEIARQIRMRGIGGIILIDFIDMKTAGEQQAIVEALRRETRQDRVRTVVCGMTSLGLVEMTRKRTSHRLWNICYDTCPVCGGTGRILSAESVVIRIRRVLEEMKAAGHLHDKLIIQCHPEVAARLQQAEEKEYMEKHLQRTISIEESEHSSREVFTILADMKR